MLRRFRGDSRVSDRAIALVFFLAVACWARNEAAVDDARERLFRYLARVERDARPRSACRRFRALARGLRIARRWRHF